MQLNESNGGCMTELVLMLKADAYGFGLEKIAASTCDLVDGFGVVSLEEGLKVRKICTKNPVLVNCLDENEIEQAIRSDLTIGVSNRLQLAKILSLCNEDSVFKSAKLALKIDSGMHRLGFDARDVECVCKDLKRAGCRVCEIYSHFGDHKECQTHRFEDACNVAREYFSDAKRHIASSHTLGDKDQRYERVRVGISAYLGAMSVTSKVVASRSVAKGEYVGYGDYMTDKRTNVATVFGGYADGIDRERFRYVFANGKRYGVIGVCMDTLLIDTGEDSLEVGCEVTILPCDMVCEIAKDMQTIPYALYTCWHGRTNKIYV